MSSDASGILRSPALRLILATFLAVTVVAGVLGHDSIPDRLAAHHNLNERVIQDIDSMGAAHLGSAYLQISPSDPGDNDGRMGIALGMLMSFSDAIDPLMVDGEPGSLFPVRKGVEQLSTLLILPLVLIGIIHIFSTAGDGARDQLARYGVRFFIIIALLWFYPGWDMLLFRGAAIPIATQLTEGEMVHHLVSTIHPDYSFSPDDDPPPQQQLLSFYQKQGQCEAEIVAAQSGGETEVQAAQDCLSSADVPLVMRDMHANAIADQWAQMEPAEFAAMVEQQTGDTYEGLRRSRLASEEGAGSSFWSSSLEALGSWIEQGMSPIETLRSAANVMAETMRDTLIGGLMMLQNLAVSIFLFFVWIMVIVARAFSLVMAPFAIVLGLWPRAEHIVQRWFTGHARIVLMPVGISFGVLIAYAAQVAILTADFGWPILGFALRFVLAILVIFLIIKGAMLSKLMAGDVAGAAQDIGQGVRETAVKSVTTALKVAGKGAGTVAGAAAGVKGGPLGMLKGGKMGWKVAGLAGKGMSAVGGKLPGGKGVKTMGDRLKGRAEQEQQKPMVAPFRFGERMSHSRVGRAVKASARHTREAARTTQEAWRQSPGQEGPATADAGKNVWKSLTEDVREQRRKRAERETAEAAPSTEKAVGEQIPKSRKARGQIQQQLGMADPERRTGEQISVDASNIELKGDKVDVQTGSAIGTELVDKVVSQGKPISVSQTRNERGEVQYDPDDETVRSITDLMDDDPQFRNKMWELAEKTFGGRDQVKTVEGRSGDLPDIQHLMRHNTAALNGVLAAAQYGELEDQELFRREVISHRLGAESESVLDRVARELPHEVATQHPSESDAEYEDRIRREATKLMRAASYFNLREKDPGALERKGISLEMSDINEIGGDQRIPVDQSWQTEPESYTHLDVEAQNNVHVAVQERSRDISRMGAREVYSGSRRYGIDLETYIKDNKQVYKAEDGSRFHQIIQENPSLANDHSKAFEEALEKALSEGYPGLPARDAGQSVEDYVQANASKVNEAIFLNQMSQQRRSSSLS